MALDCDTTHLYRHFDKDGNLLYVGISYNAIARIKQHSKSKKPWVDDIANMTIENFDTRDEALEAERLAIINEKPVHNIIHNGSPCLSTGHYLPNSESEIVEKFHEYIEDLRSQYLDMKDNCGTYAREKIKGANLIHKFEMDMKEKELRGLIVSSRATIFTIVALWVSSLAAALFFT